MNSNPTKIKFFIVLAGILTICLFAFIIFQLVSINEKKQTIQSQKEEITKLQNEIDYYQSLLEDN